MLSARKVWMAAMALTLAVVWTGAASAAPLLGIKGGGDDADKWLVNDAELVMTINIKQMTSSPLFKAGEPMLKELLKHNEEAKTLMEATGIDPFKDVESILFSASGSSAKDAKGLFVVRGKFDTDKIHTALKKEAAKKDAELELVKEGQVQLYKVKKDDNMIVAGFASKSVLVMTEQQGSDPRRRAERRQEDGEDEQGDEGRAGQVHRQGIADARGGDQ